MDLFHLSDLQKIFGIKQETKDAIEQIYDDIIGEEEWFVIFVVKNGLFMWVEILFSMSNTLKDFGMMMRFTITAATNVWKGGWTYESQTIYR